MTYDSRLTYRLFLFVLSFSTCRFSMEEVSFKGWAHLELGAGNYGQDGHTKISQTMTVLMKIENVTHEKNYIDNLEESGRGVYKPEEQYGVLFWTLDELIKRYGDVGVFHVNDLYEEYAIFAAQKLTEYALNKGYHSIIIEAVPGDYQFIDAKQTLALYGKTHYSTVHLKNPEVSFYYDQMDGDHFYASEKSRDQTRSMLKNLAHLSESGLYLFIVYHENFIPSQERTDFMEKNIFYHLTSEWESVPYIFPEGNIMDKERGKVFHIIATYEGNQVEMPQGYS